MNVNDASSDFEGHGEIPAATPGDRSSATVNSSSPTQPTRYPPEVWLRGPISGVPLLLQPVAHSLLQCREDVHGLLGRLTAVQLVERPNGAASISYHIRHAIGALDRLLTYARDESLTEEQLDALAHEPEDDPSPHLGLRVRSSFDRAVEHALTQLRATRDVELTDVRLVGRARLPSTVIGLLFHAAEHTQRHVGQAVTTGKIVRG